MRKTAQPLKSLRRSDSDIAVELALRRSFGAYEQNLEFLPDPVRHRAAGAVQAWSEAFRHSGVDGAKLASCAADPAYGPLMLSQRIENFVRQHCTLDLDNCFGGGVLPVWVAEHSMLYQAFWARDGMLYEPTQALHKLLEASDIADDIPLEQLKIPAPAFCIVTDAVTRASGTPFIDAMVFAHAGHERPDQRWLTLIYWQRDSEADEGTISYHVLRMRIDSESGHQYLSSALDDISKTSSEAGTPMENGVRKAVSYVMKVLLYLSMDNAWVAHKRPYSTAPRMFPGLGQRKRNERLQEIEKLYDRYLVGPPTWDDERGAKRLHDGTVEAHSVRTHWRRGHFRMQAFGTSAAQRKLIFVMPTVVRADRLGQVEPA